MADPVESILSRYIPNDRSNIIQILQNVQEDQGYISAEAVERISKYLRLSKSNIYGVASFYSGFKFHPSGRHCIKICIGTACHVRGAKIIVEEFERELGIKAGETTSDLEHSLETVNCLGTCALGPVVVVDEEYHGQMNVGKTKTLLEASQETTELSES